jgi:hypothetical protein
MGVIEVPRVVLGKLPRRAERDSTIAGLLHGRVLDLEWAKKRDVLQMDNGFDDRYRARATPALRAEHVAARPCEIIIAPATANLSLEAHFGPTVALSVDAFIVSPPAFGTPALGT